MNTTTKQTAELVKAAKQLLLNTECTEFLAPSLDRVRTALEPFESLQPGGPAIDGKMELYTIPCGNGYTCLGFDVLITRYNAVAAWLRSQALLADDLPPEARGSMRALTSYQRLMDRAAAYCQRNNLRCPTGLTPQLIGLEGKRVEVTEHDGNRRRFLVGKSTGWQPCHLEIARRNCSGGPAVSGAPFQSVHVI